MSKFWDKILGRKPEPLPQPFDDDVADAFVEGHSAYTAETSKRNTRDFDDTLAPPPREPRVTSEEDPDQAQHFDPPAEKRGKPFDQWEEGTDYEQTGGWVTAGQYWENPAPLAEHYNPAISKYRKGKSDEWRGLNPDSWFNYSTPTDQPLGGHLQVIVDKSTKFTHHYCQAGHLHTYRNGELATQWTKAALPGDTYPKRYLFSKHFPPHEFVVDYSSHMSARDKTIVESPLCDN